MSVDVRHPTEDELRACMQAASDAFAETFEEADWERERVSVRPARAVAAFDDGRPVGFSASYEFELSVPGGASVPTAGVTWVAVLPTHRRGGFLRKAMEQLHRDALEHGEPLAALFASEAPIYGRFGYGLATQWHDLEAHSRRIVFRDDPGRKGTVRLVDEDEAFALFPPLYEQVRAERAGMLSRNEHWWRRHRLADYEHARRGASKRYNAVLELDGSPAAYAIYRIKEAWDDSAFPNGEVRVVEAFAPTADAARELWRYLFSIDLTTRVTAHLFDPASPLALSVVDPRAVKMSARDGLWLRLLDVAEALRRRSYADGESVVLEVRDELLPENAGRYRVGGDIARVDDEPDLALDVRDLASAYLGSFDFARLVAAGRVEERRGGAVERADRLFHTKLAGYCPEVF
jgi:predicted acetyltransferase